MADLTLSDELTAESRDGWLAWRRLGIGASDVAAIVGLSPWASPMSVWADKCGLTEADPDNDYTEFGRRAEPMLCDYFEDRTGLFVVDQQALVVHPDRDHHRVTLDGRVCDHPDGDPVGVLENKTAGQGTESLWEDVIPDQYACQIQWQMHVDRQAGGWFGVLHGRKYRHYAVERDQRTIDLLVEQVDHFWHTYVVPQKPPPADGHEATAQALAAAFPRMDEGKRVDLDDLQWALDLRAQAIAKAAEAKAEKARADNHIKAAMGDAELGCIEGEPVFAFRDRHRDGYTVEPNDYRELRAIGGRR